MDRVIVVTTNEVAGHEITDVYGDIVGIVVRARDYFSNLGARLRTVVGGEVGGYTQLMLSARDEARARLADAADDVGANAVIAVRYSVADIGGIMQEFAAYGTAVRIVANEPSSVTLHFSGRVLGAESSHQYVDLPPAQAEAMRKIDAQARVGQLDVIEARAQRAQVRGEAEIAVNLKSDNLHTAEGIQAELDRVATEYKSGRLSMFENRRLKAHLKKLQDDLGS